MRWHLWDVATSAHGGTAVAKRLPKRGTPMDEWMVPILGGLLIAALLAIVGLAVGVAVDALVELRRG